MKKTGFTLIEILVAVVILSTLIAGVLFSINPLKQISKAQDAARQNDLKQVKEALENYYHDNNCYPSQSEGIPFGKEWSVTDSKGNKTIYMKKVPQDPSCTDTTGTNCYRYRTDGTTCPQWNVTFSELSKNSSLTNACALSSLANGCTPEGYTGGTWACSMLGAVDCNGLAASASIIGGVETSAGATSTPAQGATATSVPGATSTPVATPSPTLTPASIPGIVTFSTSNPVDVNPDIYSVTMIPLCQTILDQNNNPNVQQIQVNMSSVAPISSVLMKMYSDNETRNFTLNRSAGTDLDGTWSGTWDVTDTYDKIFGVDITASDSANNTFTSELRFKCRYE